ncbi:hypothetical protein HHI36_019452 [Cryptolaemus montrouzieri]|uniref:Deoxyribodipyrimidine photo-lyase n=1 Tax=Cryptolaemus montrouzieri TaxID=559131 RepID=A0ABD2P372_9CUCU
MALRLKILKQLPKFLTEFPEVCKQDKKEELEIDPALLWTENDQLDIEYVKEITWAEPGEAAGFEMLRTYLLERLQYYGTSSYDPSKKHQSFLSPWIHFGQISTQRIALEVVKLKNLWKEQCERFLNEAIIRKEISDNFCLYNPNYDNFEGAEQWAKSSLDLHRTDKRNFIYTPEQFEKALTHDPIWNSAQIQLVTEGKLHGYMRMYWCKKMLEWTESPEKAIEIGLYLNDKYSIDGSDPNGFVGVMWSVCGVHDQGFKERPVFGKIRFMVDYSISKKYDLKTYCSRYRPTANSEEKTGFEKKTVDELSENELKDQSKESDKLKDHEEINKKKPAKRNNTKKEGGVQSGRKKRKV